MSYKVETVAEKNNICGEAPTWDAARQRLLWVDNESALVYQLTPNTDETTTLSENLPVSGIALTNGEALVFGGATGLHVWTGPEKFRTIADTYNGEKLAINDLIADPRGRVYAGTLYWGPNGMEKFGRLYVIDTDGTIQIADEGIELSNGLAFSPDDKTLYFTDSSARKIYAYDYDAASGRISKKRVLIQISTDEGIPDGLTVDREGYLWSAQWYGSQIVRYDPQGKVERRIAMPVQQVSSVAFGGKDLTDLYITTAGGSWPSEYAPPCYDPSKPNGGSLYRIRLDIQGRLEHMANLS